MAVTVWKFDVPVMDRPVVNMPGFARLLHVAHQPGQPEDVIQLWALVDAESDRRDRPFILAGTGHPVDPGWMHVGSACTPNGMVWHLFEDMPF